MVRQTHQQRHIKGSSGLNMLRKRRLGRADLHERLQRVAYSLVETQPSDQAPSYIAHTKKPSIIWLD